MLRHLKHRGLVVEPVRGRREVRGPRPPRPWAVRKPRDWRVEQPGDLAQIDTLELCPIPGLVLKQFTAQDVLPRWDGGEVRDCAASTAVAFLDTLQQRLPFPLRAIQVDDGSKFAAPLKRTAAGRASDSSYSCPAPPN
jgi:putative transposase